MKYLVLTLLVVRSALEQMLKCIVSHTVAMTQRPVSDSPRFYHFCVEQFMSLSFILPKSHSSASYFYLITLPRQDRMP